MHDPAPLDLATLLAAVNGGPDGSVTPPIVQTSLFAFDNYQQFVDRMAGETTQPVYSRVQNPTVAAFENLMAQAEAGEAAVGFASGMAAISSTVLAFLRPGDRIACIEHVYPDTYRLFERMLRPFGVEITYHPAEAFERNADLLAGVRMAYLESPSSLVFKPINLPLVAEHARRHDALTVIDNSWATPVFQRPLTLGIDLVVHSASKYISGHSDTVAGVVAGSAALIGRIRDLTLPLLGGKLAPFEAWLLIRGLRTLEVRMQRHQSTADYFVTRLAAHPLVTAIHSPGPNSVPGLTGRAGLMSVELDDRVDIPRFVDSLRHFRIGVSWGGFESLVLPAQATLSQQGKYNSAQRFGVSSRLVRFSLGLESPTDLWADMEAALSKSVA
ncbi:MAG: aminotransferase class I/II-fold pyridoxal phosphate-dependent enzyme [Tabrizicola sp.]|jgi:cystathionine beta-lyase/cystathionine gamma-synthase|uniref:aminotransferase class I/II-fold pyridoxal phosphate-dependent enzyme n=1 Tax=Tabrizicola sp. TaxID=2005166 RepID=UPI003BB1A8F8